MCPLQLKRWVCSKGVIAIDFYKRNGRDPTEIGMCLSEVSACRGVR